MEQEIKKILLTYSVLSEIKQVHKSQLLNEGTWYEKETGLLSKLETTFRNVIRDFQYEMSSVDCFSTYTSGLDRNRKNEDSYHKEGKAVDIRTFDHAQPPQSPYLTQKCIDKALQICSKLKSKYPKLYCSHEKSKSESSEDFTAPHFHIEYGDKASSDISSTGEETPVDTAPKVDPLVQSVFGAGIEKITNPIRTKLQSVASSFLKEQFDFGNSSVKFGGKILIKPSTDKIKSPIKGKFISNKFMSGCLNQILIKSVNGKFYLQYCGMTNPKKLRGTIYMNQILGESSGDVEVTLYDESFNVVNFNSVTAMKITSSDEEKYGWLPVSGQGDGEEPKEPKEPYRKQKEYAEPLVGAVGELLLTPFKAKFWKNLTSSQQKKVNEDLQKIKRLLK